MEREKRLVREVGISKGTLTDSSGNQLRVTFNLNQWQDFIDGIPSLRSAGGWIQFKNRNDAFKSTDGKKWTLEGGGIRADVFVVSDDRFRVTGPVHDA